MSIASSKIIMPVFIILVWVFASTGIKDLSKAARRKILAALVVGFLTSVLLVIQYRYSRSYYSTQKLSVAETRLSADLVQNYGDSVIENYRTPISHVAYIKTHKTGSSTVASIFMEYAATHNLTLALPSKGSGNKLGWPDLFHLNDAVPANPDILCYHSRYSEDMVKYMPSDTIFISTLRDPARQLQSAYEYFNAQSCLGVDYEQFLSSTNKEIYLTGSDCKRFFNWWLRNGQIFDLGLDSMVGLSETKVRRWINFLDKRFEVMLILEELDESLILMRDLLKWKLDDLVYFKQNFQLLPTHKPNNSSDSILRKQAQRWNWADQLLYDHFLQRHKQAISAKPAYYRAEVKKLKQRIGLWKARCVKTVVPGNMIDNKYLKPMKDTLGGYVLTSYAYSIDKCAHLTMSEVAKIRLLNSGRPITAAVLLQGKASPNTQS